MTSEEARQEAYDAANARHPLPISDTEEFSIPEPATPLEALKRALGRAYSDRLIGRSPSEVRTGIRRLLADNPAAAALAGEYRKHLAGIVRARSIGHRCACVLTERALQDLSAALEERADV